MVFLERSKVHLTCELASQTVLPGGVVSGVVGLQVKEIVTFSSLRLYITGTEILEVMVHEGTSTMVLKDDIPYVNHCITVTGPAHSTGDRTRQSYDVGSYSFPFTLNLPSNCPPSFAVGTQSGRSTMRYAVKAVLEIPSGFDATCEQSFRVLSVAPESQCSRVQCGGRQEERAAAVYKRAVLCCLCGRKDGCEVRVTAKTAPGVFCVGSQPSSSLTVYLCVDNTRNDEELTGVKVQLRNVCAIIHDRHESMSSTTVASTHIPDTIAPGESHEMVVELNVPIDQLRHKQRESYDVPLPTFTTSTTRSTYFIDVIFPRNAIGAGLKYVGLVNVVHEATSTLGLRDAPGLFQALSSSRPTESRYVATPARVEFPADMQALYDAEPLCYLPADSAEPGAVRDEHIEVTFPDSEADGVEKHEPDSGLYHNDNDNNNSRRRATATRLSRAHSNVTLDDGAAVDAVVVRGNVVRGIMRGIDDRRDDDDEL